MQKYNVDASAAMDGSLGAVGAIARDETGTFMGASAVVFKPPSNPRIIETLLAIREAQALVWRLPGSLFVISDCKVAVDAP